MLVLGIESSCDETACSLVKDGREVLSNVVASQFDLHTAYGGVVPELACRRHVDVILPLLQEALEIAQVTLDEVDLIAATHGPGLIGALLIGLNTAKALSLATGKPFIGVNHIEAHLYAALMSHPETLEFPAIGAILSGGHTSLVKIHGLGSYELIGETADDAVGEAFDKVAKILGLPYPGGPEIEKLALSGNPHRYPFKPGKVKGSPFAFSFSGLKTNVLYTVNGQNKQGGGVLSDEEKRDIAASFQRAALEDIVFKTLDAARASGCRHLVFGGGVTNNKKLKELFTEHGCSYGQFWPSTGLSLDNAAMIAGLGYHHYVQRGADPLDLDALTRISL